MCEHVHQWKQYQEDALGFYEKREGGEPFSCRGRALICLVQPCDTFLFIPHNVALNPSEAVLVKSFAQMAAA